MLNFVLVLVALVIVITIHEFSHAWVANYFGDPTPKVNGRVSLNPLKHLDPIGTLMMFLVQLGWGKPVPVNPNYFQNPKRDEALTALAGPASNLVLALLIAIPLRYFGEMMNPDIRFFLVILMDISIILFAFNMLPFPPLDGSKFLGWFIPKAMQRGYSAFLANGTAYFLVFLVLDRFILARYFGFSILSGFIGFVLELVKSLIFLGM
jgi:Zn-dependent protease